MEKLARAAPRGAMGVWMRRLVPCLLIAGLLSASAGLVAAAEPAGSVRQVALGVSATEGLSPSRTDDLAALDAFADDVDQMPAVWTVWSDWGSASGAFPDAALLNGLQARDVVPMIMWQPTGPSWEDGRYKLAKIKKGVHDAYIREWAQAAKAYGGTILLRFAHEMNGYWFPWGIDQFNNTPAKFQAAWIRVWNIFDSVGASNVKFVWSPMTPCGGCASYVSVYPGHQYVDLASFSAFNWGGERPWRSMVKTFTKSMNALAVVTRKKVVVAETGSNRVGGDKAAWIRNGYPAVYDAFPKIKAIVYFNLDMRFAGQPNWLLSDPAGALDAYRFILGQPRFQGAIL